MEAKSTHCSKCGVVIQQWTFDSKDGLCAPCWNRKRAINEDYVEDSELTRRAEELELDPSYFHNIARKQGIDLAFRIAEKIAKGQENHRTWFPRLLEFSESCRRSHPVPSDDELTPLEIGIRGVIAQKIEKLERDAPPSLNHRALICELPLIAFSVAMGLWPEKIGTVLLTPGEFENWWAKVNDKVDRYSWSAHFFWRVRELPLDRECLVAERKLLSLKSIGIDQSTQPFLFSTGMYFGELAGHGFNEIWGWDGRQFNFIQLTSLWDS